MVHKIRLHRVLLAGALTAIAACGRDAIEDRWPEFRVRGTVSDPAGEPVGDASVWVQTFSGPECSESRSFTGPYLTGEGGRYGGTFSNGLGHFIGCVEVRVTPPATTGLAALVQRTDVVELHVEGPTAGELTLDVRLPEVTAP